MKFRKTAIALAAISLCPALPLNSQTASVTIEAESMSLTTYAPEGTLIRLPSATATGSASKTFNGSAGTYNIQVHVVPEGDGRPTVALHKGGTQLFSYSYPLGGAPTSFTVSNVTLNPGDVLKLVGQANAGAYARVDKIVLTPVAAATSTPFSGTPIALPKAFPAATYDKGGQGVAYKDLTVGNSGAQYRTAEDVDIVASTDASGGGYAISSFQAGEWMAYTVNVPTTRSYDLAVKVASTMASPLPTFHVEVDGVNVSGPLTVPNTGSADSFQWVGKQGVTLNAGKRVVKVVADQQLFRLNALSVLDSSSTAPSTSTDKPTTSTIEAESMSLSTYTSEGTRIRLPSSTSTGTATKAFSGATGTYDMQVHVLAESDGRPTLELHKGGTKLTTYTYPQTAGASSFSVRNVALNPGEVIKLVGAGNAGAYARVDKIVLTPSTGTAAPTPPAPEAPAPAPAPLPTAACANPSSGYEGFGRNTTGGAGKSIYRVTSLADSGTGSLRDALSQGNRCIVFDVGGTISLSNDLIARGANITIDGLTAPSPGITLRNRALVLQGNSGAGNIVVRGIRSRGTGSGVDAMRVYNAANVVFDRVSINGFGDGAIDVTEKARDVTIQWSILGAGIASHNLLTLIAYGATRVSVHHNLYINGDDRQPKCDGPSGATSPSAEIVCDVRNNVVWGYKNRGTAVRGYGTGNVVDNYYQTSTSSAGQTVYVAEGGRAYVRGNISANGWNLEGLGTQSTPYPALVPGTTDALTAAQQVLANAGARGPKFGLDAVDKDYIGQVKLGGG